MVPFSLVLHLIFGCRIEELSCEAFSDNPGIGRFPEFLVLFDLQTIVLYFQHFICQGASLSFPVFLVITLDAIFQKFI